MSAANGAAQQGINVDTGQGNKSGSAQVGNGGDTWNRYYPDDGMGGLFSNGVLVPLNNTANVATTAGLLMYNVDSEGNTWWGDEMFDYYLAATGTNLLLYITNATAGVYDLYLYGHGSTDPENSIFDVSSGATYHGRKQTGTTYDWNDGNWAWYENHNYVKYSQIPLNANGVLQIEVLENSLGKAIVNGLQLQPVSIPAGDWDGDGIDNATEIQTTGTDPKAADTDGDGINDGEEQTNGTNPLDPSSLIQQRLVLFTFDDAGTWAGDVGQSPLVTANLTAVSGQTNGAVELQSTTGNAAKLVYNRVESSATVSASLNQGAVRFLFKPNWSTSSGGPGKIARLVELGSPSQDTEDGTWSLYVTADGANVKFVTRVIGERREHLSVPIWWSAGQWYQIILNYNGTGTELLIDGLQAGTGTAVSGFIKPGNLSLGSNGGDGVVTAPQWFSDPGFTDPRTNWEWSENDFDYFAGFWTGTWIEDPNYTNPNTYYRDVYDENWNYIYSGDGYWVGSSDGENGSANGSFDEFAAFNHTISGGLPSLPSVNFTPPDGTTVPVNVTLSVPGHSGATIYYTTDGSNPTQSSTVYSGPISVTTLTTVKAVASEAGYGNSSIGEATYPLPTLPNVAFSPGDGSLLPATVTLSVPGHSGATIRYTVDGSLPTSQSPAYTGPLALSESQAGWSDNLVPAMDEQNSSSHSWVHSSAYSLAEGWQAFRDTSQEEFWEGWVANSDALEWLEFEFPTHRVISRYALMGDNSGYDKQFLPEGLDVAGPRDWELQGWDGASWVKLDERSGEKHWKEGESRTYTTSAVGAYKKYRLYIYSGNAGPYPDQPTRITVGKFEMEERQLVVNAFAEQTGYDPSGITIADYYASAPQLPPTIEQQPQDQWVAVGDTMTLYVRATGTAPFTYQWYLDGVPISDTPSQTIINGGAAQQLTIENIAAENVGAYTVQVANTAGSATSSSASATFGHNGQPVPNNSATFMPFSMQQTDDYECYTGYQGKRRPKCAGSPSGCNGGKCVPICPPAYKGQRTSGLLAGGIKEASPAPESYSNSGQTTGYGFGEVGANKFDVFSGGAFREIPDLAVHGGVGSHHLLFMRSNDTSVENQHSMFGEGAQWRHSYQWDVYYKWDGLACGGAGVSIQTPQGQNFEFNAADVLGQVLSEMNAAGITDPSWEELVRYSYTSSYGSVDEFGVPYLAISPDWEFDSVMSGDPDFELRNYDFTNLVVHYPSGWKYDFQMEETDPTQPEAAPIRSAFLQFQDAHGSVYPVALDAQLYPTNISEPAGRWMSIRYNSHRDIDRVETWDGRYATYHYTDVIDEYSVTHRLLTSVDYHDGYQAAYQYYDIVGFGPIRYRLAVMDDPKLIGAAAQIQYLYGTGNGRGMVVGEMNPVSGRVLAKMVSVAGLGQGSAYTVINASGSTNFYYGLDEAETVGTPEGTTYSKTAGSPLHSNQLQGLNVFTETDALGRRTVNVLTTNHLLLDTIKIDADDNILRREAWSRNLYGLELTYTNPLGGVITYSRTANHLLEKITYPDGSWEGYKYNSFNQVTHHTNLLGGVTEYQFDTVGNLTNRIDAAGNPTGYTYDSNGRLATMTDGNGNTTTYIYDASQRQTATIHADNTVAGITYDKYSNKIFQTNELGNVWSWEFNELNQRITATDPLDRTTTFHYNLNPGCCGSSSGVSDAPVQIVSPSGRETRIAYDDAGRQSEVITAFGISDAATNFFLYDAVGRLTNRVDAMGNVHRTEYELFDRQVAQKDPALNTTVTFRDAAGNQTGILRPDNVTTTNYYTSQSRLLISIDTAGQTNSFIHDHAGNLLTLTDARGASHHYTYNKAGQKLVMTYPGGSKEQWSYNAVGAVATYTNRAGTVKTSYFDNRNRETNCVWNDGVTPAVTRTYDAAGRLSTLNSSVSQLTYSYDAANQLLAETQTVNGQLPRPVTYIYNDDGQRHAITYPNGTIITNAYTAAGLLQSLTLRGASAPLATYEYDLAGRRTLRTYDNNTASIYEYTANSQTSKITHTNTAGVFGSFEYGYDNLGHRLWEQREDGLGDAYRYDVLGQVTNVQYKAVNVSTTPSGSTRVVNYSFDPNGNRNSVTDNGTIDTYAANDLNQYTNLIFNGGASTPTYDGNGNLTSAMGQQNVYDAQNRLLSSEVGTNRMFFEYDAKNRCVRREIHTFNGSTWAFSHQYLLYYDSWNLIEERAVNGSAICYYLHGPNTDEILTRTGVAGSIYRYENALGSVSHLASNAGTVVEKYDYDVFGTATVRNVGGISLAGSGYSNRFLFTGREWLALLRTHEYRNRIYSSTLGRFLQADPIKFSAGDINLYRYVKNTPSEFVDPSGLISLVLLAATGVAGITAWLVYAALKKNFQQNPQMDFSTAVGVAVGAMVSSFLFSLLAPPPTGGTLIAGFLIGGALIGAAAGFAAFAAENGWRWGTDKLFEDAKRKIAQCTGLGQDFEFEVSAGFGVFFDDIEEFL